MYILSIDQSTSSTKAILVDKECRILGRVNKDHEQIYPQPGWVEHDPVEIYNNLIAAAAELVKTQNISWDDIAALSISNQRETVVVWDKVSGLPVCNAIVWQCSRATELCSQLDTPEINKAVRASTGLMLSPYFSGAKIMWVLENVDGAREKAEKGQLLAGTMESWLIWKLTGQKVHATDYSNASRMSLLNLSTLKWDEEICSIFTVPPAMLPEIRPSDTIWGETDLEGAAGKSIPIAGMLGDSHAALFAQLCFKPGMVKTTYGTGSSVMMNVGKSRSKDVPGLVSSLGWGTREEVVYVLEGNINCTGATIKWMQENLQIIDKPSESEKYALSVENTGGVYFVPAFSGLSAPYWDNNAKAMVCGITFNTRKEHIIRAGSEAIAYQIADVVELMTSGSGTEVSTLRTDGGPTRDNFLMQFQADILGCKVASAQTEELSALGAAMMGGLAVGIWKDRGEFSALFTAGRIFEPKMPVETRNEFYDGWKKAVKKARESGEA